MKSNTEIRNYLNKIAMIPHKRLGRLGYIFGIDIKRCIKQETFTAEESFREMGG